MPTDRDIALVRACEHKWVYEGVVYWQSEYPLPGSGAYHRIYGDKYFCERCLETTIRNERKHGNTYEHPIAGTMPK